MFYAQQCILTMKVLNPRNLKGVPKENQSIILDTGSKIENSKFLKSTYIIEIHNLRLTGPFLTLIQALFSEIWTF